MLNRSAKITQARCGLCGRQGAFAVRCIQCGRAQQVASLNCSRTKPHRRRGFMVDYLFFDLSTVAHAENIDLDFRLKQCQTFGSYYGKSTGVVAKMAIPDIHEFWQIIDVREIDLRLYRILDRAAASLESRFEA